MARPQPKLAALSVDLDEIPNYFAIHGLPHSPEDRRAHAVYERAVPRFRALLAELSVPCTFFVIGSDLQDERAMSETRLLANAGHELANHTQNHRYDLTRLSRAEMTREVMQGMQSIARAQGRPPAGFRAPGYTITDELFDVLSECHVAYDSSVFPCPAYWAAKTSMIGWISLRGRQSRSVVDTPAMLQAPADPYRVGDPYWRKSDAEGGLIELPIGVTRGARLPYIGTSVMLAGTRANWLTSMMLGRPLINLEMHGLDLLGAGEDDLASLAVHQRDLAVSVELKLNTLRAVVKQLQRSGYRFVTLFEAARHFAS
ncbi:MAG: polysaccharide deacetylase family protein [Deltaproteobacteria bacterium]|nr:polysaccharide deacetylase family protein [Deltaproteobacteria bacterium]